MQFTVISPLESTVKKRTNLSLAIIFFPGPLPQDGRKLFPPRFDAGGGRGGGQGKGACAMLSHW